jgi:hypothetical protein
MLIALDFEIDFFTMNRPAGSIDPNPDLVTSNLDHHDPDVVVDHDAFVSLP